MGASTTEARKMTAIDAGAGRPRSVENGPGSPLAGSGRDRLRGGDRDMNGGCLPLRSHDPVDDFVRALAAYCAEVDSLTARDTS